MTPPARLQAASEILDEVIAAARDEGPPADVIVTRYFKQRRYAGSGDRRAVRELVFRAIRRSAETPLSGRAAILGLAVEEPALLELFGQPRGPEPQIDGEQPAAAGVVPEWLVPNSHRSLPRTNGADCSSARPWIFGSTRFALRATMC